MNRESREILSDPSVLLFDVPLGPLGPRDDRQGLASAGNPSLSWRPTRGFLLCSVEPSFLGLLSVPCAEVVQPLAATPAS